MATVTNYDINWTSNQIIITFDESITAINTGEWFLENQSTTYEARLSLASSSWSISQVNDAIAIITVSDFVLNAVKDQSTDYVDLTTIGLSNRSVDASTPALSTANTNHGAVNNFNADTNNPTLDEVIYAPATDVSGDVTSFTLKFSKPLVTDLPLTEIFGDDGTNTPVALTADSTYTQSTVDPRYVTIAVGTTDRTTFSTPFKAANGGISTAATTTGAGWNSNTLTPVAANSPVVKTVLSGTNQVVSFDSIQYDGTTNIVLTFANDVDYLDPTGLTINTGGLVTVLTGGTATISGDEVTISMSDADLSDLQQAIFSAGIPAFDSAGVSLTAVGASVPVGYITSPLLVATVTINPSLVPGVVSFDYYSKDASSSYDAILTFNVAGFTVADITDFRFQDAATGTPGNTTNLSAGTTVTRIDDYAYGISLNSTDATAINGWATSNPANVYFGFSAAGALTYLGADSVVTTTYFQAAAVYESISPDFAYTYNQIAVRSDNLAGELKLTSTSRYDATTIRTAANTTVGGVIQFKDAPTENVPGRVLKVASYDATDAVNPVLTVDWQDAGVTRLVAGDNITLSAETGAVVVSSTASGGGSTHYTGDAGDVALASNTQINAAISGTAVNGDSFVNTNTGTNNTQPYYVYVNSGWRQVSSSASA